MTTATAQPHSAFSIFRNRSFTLMWIGQLVTEMGTSLTALASSIYVYKITGSALNVGLMMMASAAPSLVVGLIAGVFVDRYDRKRIMMGSDLIRAVLIAAIPFLLPVNVAWLYILVMLSAAVGQFFNPAHASVLPEIATEEELNAANSLMAISSFGALVIGYAAAGLIAGQYPIEWVFYIDAFTFLISATLIALTQIPKINVDEETNVASVFQNLRAGFRVITSSKLLRSMFIVFFFIFITFGFGNAIRLPFSIKALGATEFEFGLIESVTLIGFVIASLWMAQLGDRLREGQWLAISFIGMGFTGIAFSVSSVVWMALIIIVIEGFLNAPSVIARSLIMQRNTPREARGRVFSAFFVMRDTMFMSGMALAGLADVFDVRWLYLIGSLLVLGLGIWALILPGLGQPAAEWRRAIILLRSAPDRPGLGLGRALTPADFDRLTALVPAITGISQEKSNKLRANMTLHEVEEGTCIIRRYETSDAAYFILEGQAVAGWDDDGITKVLEVLRTGDFFGEIAALTGVPRTANVISEQPTALIRVPANILREMSSDLQLNRIFMTRMTERMIRMNMIDVARLGRYDQQALLELRTETPSLS
ncbi:MAG TPA: MFS transporter [Anaerolineales bacterium]|nr:MFS transporter [Anaerolineales bacterium]